MNVVDFKWLFPIAILAEISLPPFFLFFLSSSLTFPYIPFPLLLSSILFSSLLFSSLGWSKKEEGGKRGKKKRI
jgi:hypothetical protein